MIQIPLTPEQYQSALNKLMQAKHPDIDAFVLPNAGHPGQIQTPQVLLEYTYDGSAELSVTIKQKFGIAKFASENTIKSHLLDLLSHLG